MNDVKQEMAKHNLLLSDYACKDSDAIYLKKEKSKENEIRTSFFHDIDRIIYSLAFIRYQDKTQVFSFIYHDHVAKRMIHVQFVSKIARTIGRALSLNEDLIEAASLGHDLGHVPFGHVGESILNKISLENNEGYFNHNIESVRNLMFIENHGKGLNISLQVLDAIMCHNGELAMEKYAPVNKTKNEFLQEYELSYKEDINSKLRPMTLEGCVVRISDMVAYLGRDIDDAIRLNMLKREDIPKEITDVLGNNTKDIVHTCIIDIIKNSYGKNYIKFSKEVYKAIKDLKTFNYENIYFKSNSYEERENLDKMFRTLFASYLTDIKSNNTLSPIIYSYLKNMDESYIKNNTKERIVIDYIAGMTDDYFVSEYNRITIGN